jgi:unsaturated rhamnogalacturonyl hydrolase
MMKTGMFLVLIIVFAFSPKQDKSDLQQKRPAAKHSNSVVLLDYYFNNEWKKDPSGNAKTRWHYTWEDPANSGFSILGELFRKNGMTTASLETEPTKKKLKNASVYIIVDPDTEKETEKPNYITEEHADVISKWVKKGGVLILMGNDSINANLKSLNVLSSRFGIRFNEDMFNPVLNRQWEQGSVLVPATNSIFSSPKKLYLKEVSTLQVSAPATSILTKDGKNIMAIAKYGKGVVFAVGDPWIYNEYIDHRFLPAEFNNDGGAEDLVKWAITHAKK